MSTKNNPGEFDCYANAGPDEEMFILLARDPTAAHLVRAWRCLRAGQVSMAKLHLDNAMADLGHAGKSLLPLHSKKSKDAENCANAMIAWQVTHTE